MTILVIRDSDLFFPHLQGIRDSDFFHIYSGFPHLLGYIQIVLSEQTIADFLYKHVFGAISVSVCFSSFFHAGSMKVHSCSVTPLFLPGHRRSPMYDGNSGHFSL